MAMITGTMYPDSLTNDDDYPDSLTDGDDYPDILTNGDDGEEDSVGVDQSRLLPPGSETANNGQQEPHGACGEFSSITNS